MMRCIFCLLERPRSVEHVFPLAIGGKLTTDRVCQQCNSTLGSRVDSALSDFPPVRQRRAELALAGNAEPIRARINVCRHVAAWQRVASAVSVYPPLAITSQHLRAGP
jgi:hypothetical protein